MSNLRYSILLFFKESERKACNNQEESIQRNLYSAVFGFNRDEIYVKLKRVVKNNASSLYYRAFAAT